MRPPVSLTTAAFVAVVVIGGLNFVAVRASNAELPPFWGAALRFATASVLLFAAAAILRTPFPRGAALVGTSLYGVLGFAAGYALAYWALVEVPAGLASVVMALVPLLTLVMAALIGVERLHRRAVLGGTLAVGGVAIVFGERIGALDVPLLPLLAMLGAAVSAGATNVVVKRFPRAQPLAANAIAMGIGSALLAGTAMVAGEPMRAPVSMGTWVAVGYLVLVGSITMFLLFLFVLGRWAASSTSYVFVLSPLVAIPVGAAIAREPVTLAFLAGGALVLVGVYLGTGRSPAKPAAPATPLPECCPPGALEERPSAERPAASA